MEKAKLIEFRNEIAKEFSIANKKLNGLKSLIEEVEREVIVRRSMINNLDALIEMNEE